MNKGTSCIFEGTVVHKRLRPKPHAFAYRVFTLCLDLDDIDHLDQSLRFFSRNRRNLLSFHDADFGDPGPGTVGEKARNLLSRAGYAECGARIELVCYPRLFGYVFNPLSVYFCRTRTGRVGAVIYEVTNTFGERQSYVIPVDGDNGIAQKCSKDMYVSPFTTLAGSYGFHAIAPDQRVVIGVNFREGGRPTLKTHFRGERQPITDRMIASVTTRYPLMTLKVMAAIHVEAVRLWTKGIPVIEHQRAPAYSFTVVNHSTKGAQHG